MTPSPTSTPALFDFLRRLRQDNRREWFQQHRQEYDALRQRWIADLGRVASAMSAWLPAMASVDPSQCAYRIYRDTRFSHDKTPYKTYFSATFSPYGRTTHRAAYYLEAIPDAPDRCGLWVGTWNPEPPMLAKLRRAIADCDDEWLRIVRDPALTEAFPRWTTDNALRTAPKGWDRSHPMIEYLRLRDVGRFCPLDQGFFGQEDWPERVAELFAVAAPLVDFINYSFDE